VIGKACWRHHAVERDSAACIVELQQKAAVDNHLVFRAHRPGDRSLQFSVAFVVFVLPIGDHACRRGDRQERLLHFHALQRALKLSMSPCSSACPVYLIGPTQMASVVVATTSLASSSV